MFMNEVPQTKILKNLNENTLSRVSRSESSLLLLLLLLIIALIALLLSVLSVVDPHFVEFNVSDFI